MFEPKKKEKQSQSTVNQNDLWQSQGGRQLTPPQFSLTSSPPVQMVKGDKKTNELTYCKLCKQENTSSLRKLLIDVRENVKQEMKDKYDQRIFETAWNAITKPLKNNKDSDLFKDKDALVDKMIRSIKGRQSRSKKAKRRKGFNQTTFEKIKTLQNDVKLDNNVKAPKIDLNSMNQFDFDSSMGDEQRFERHLSTFLFSQFGGTESQTSISRDHKTLFTGTNINKTNNEIRKKVRKAEDILESGREFLKKRRIGDLSLDMVNNNRKLRHVSKLVSRHSEIIKKVDDIKIPEKSKKDGKHIELRIVDDKDWNQVQFHMPMGTKLPCMGCFSYMNHKNLPVGNKMGPLWTSSCSIHTQLERFNNNNFTTSSIDENSKFFDLVMPEFENSLKVGQMGHGKHRDGRQHDEYDADSEDDLTEKEFEELKKMIKKNSK